MPIWFYGERLVIVMQETDPELPEKIKELLWILFTHAANERRAWRSIYWVFLTIAGVLFGVAFIDNICRALVDHSLFYYIGLIYNALCYYTELIYNRFGAAPNAS